MVAGQTLGRLRLFVAVTPPSERLDSIAEVMQRFQPQVAGARWTAREGWHATLKFLGEVDESLLGAVPEIVAMSVRKAAPITSHLTHIGGFPSLRRPRVIWAGLADDDHQLEHLAARMEKKFGQAGFRSEARKLRPHITLARVKAGLKQSAGDQSLADLVEEVGPDALDSTPFAINEATLFRTHLSPKGSRYEVVARYPFGG